MRYDCETTFHPWWMVGGENDNRDKEPVEIESGVFEDYEATVTPAAVSVALSLCSWTSQIIDRGTS